MESAPRSSCQQLCCLGRVMLVCVCPVGIQLVPAGGTSFVSVSATDCSYVFHTRQSYLTTVVIEST
eukprot:m.662166 g.662166  ORF g.662166 m.662166 type:complete len:66 (+) comp22738_c0_seq22:2547-2744(+)